MEKLTLLERLSGSHEYCDIEADQIVIRSVARNISLMLTARQGTAMTLPDYGLPDLNHSQQSFHDLIRETIFHIKTMIQKYEPRMHNTKVHHLVKNHNNPLSLSFCINGQIEVNGVMSHVDFTADLHRGGKVTLR